MGVGRPVTRPGWQDQAACRGRDISLFFGADGERGPSATVREKEAAAVCGGCPVIAECGEHALGWPEGWGTWGGLTAAERREVTAG